MAHNQSVQAIRDILKRYEDGTISCDDDSQEDKLAGMIIRICDKLDWVDERELKETNALADRIGKLETAGKKNKESIEALVGFDIWERLQQWRPIPGTPVPPDPMDALRSQRFTGQPASVEIQGIRCLVDPIIRSKGTGFEIMITVVPE